jgi:hypothetical protein
MRPSFIRKATPAPTSEEIVGDLLGELVTEILFPLDLPPLSTRKGDCRVSVTLTPDSFYHAMAVVRGVRGHEEMARHQIRAAALSWLGKRECAMDCLLEGVFTRGEYRHLTKKLLPVPLESYAPPEFVKYLHGPGSLSNNGTDWPTSSEPVTHKSPYEIGMRRAMRAMQEKRSELRRPYLRYQSDLSKYYPEHRPDYKRPKTAEYGQRMREYLATFVKSQEGVRQHPTLYEIDAAAWALPERTPIMLYYQDKHKKIKHLLFGPPRLDVEPYRFMWSGNEDMRFWPVVNENQKELARRLVDECKGELPDILGRDEFEATSTWREQLCYAEETLSQQAQQAPHTESEKLPEQPAPAKVTNEALAEWLDVSADTVQKLRSQIEIEQQWAVVGTFEASRRKRWAERDRRKERSQYTTVSIKMRVDDPYKWHTGGAERKYTRQHSPSVDPPVLVYDDPFTTHKIDKHKFWEFAVACREQHSRNPTPEEVAERYNVTRRQAIQLIDHGEDDWRRLVKVDRSWEYPIKESPDAQKRARAAETAKERDQRQKRETREWNQRILHPELYE